MVSLSLLVVLGYVTWYWVLVSMSSTVRILMSLNWVTLFFFQLKFLSYEELQQRMANLDSEMEREIYELRRRYQAKRQPILDAMDQKRKRQQNF